MNQYQSTNPRLQYISFCILKIPCSVV